MPLWIPAAPLVLASKSAIRRRILEQAGIPVEIRPADVDERGIENAAGPMAPAAAATLLAGAKARAVSAAMPGRVVIGADQTLILGNKRFSKPTGRDAARAQLMELSGCVHSLYSAVAVVQDGAELFTHCGKVDMTMRAMSAAFIETYLAAAGDHVLTSVGGYQIEGPGIQLFERIDGDYFTILGLPLLPLLHGLRHAGLLAT